MAYTKYSLTPANNNAAPPDGAPEGMLPSAVNDTMRDMMAQIRDVGDGIRGGTYTMTAPVITGGSITGVALSGNTLTNPVITGGSINNTPIGASTRNTGAFTTLTSNGATTFTAGTASTTTTTGTAVITGGLGVSGRINAANFDGIIGANTAAAGSFTTLSASSTVSGTGFSDYLASPPAIGSSTASTGRFTTVTATSLTSGRVAYVGTSGLLQDDADFTFNGTTVTMANDASISGLTVGKGGGAVSTNTAAGASALAANTSGAQNTAFGQQALLSNTSGANNTGVGRNALALNTTGSDNAASGYHALLSNTTGGSNSAFGVQALNSNTTASNNTAVGYQAGYSNTTGAANAFFGLNAGYAVTTGYNNTFIGAGAGSAVSTGVQNTIIGTYNGNQGGLDIRTASNYIVLSDGAGNPRQVIDSTGNLLVGTTSTLQANMHSFVGASNTGGQLAVRNSTSTAGKYFVIGATPDATPFFIIQNEGGTGVYISPGGTSWTGTSDERLKTNLKPITDAANKISTLRAVTGRFLSDKDTVSRSFLLAQDVQKVLPEAVTEKADGTLGLAYTDTIPLLVAAIQELKAEVDSLKQQLNGA